jgi:hypothetical protein
MNKLLVISFDAVASDEWENLSNRRNMAAFSREADVTLGVNSVFLTNTYPVHCSVITGQPPAVHGLISNTAPFPDRNPLWRTDAKAIRARTLWQAAAESGLSTAAVLWPCTGHSPHIRHNIPEIHTRPNHSQILANLNAGSKLLQLRMFVRHGRLLNGINQPALDRFVTACAADILREYHPDLTLVHLTCYDAFCHRTGRAPERLAPALDSLDENLGILLDTVKSNTSVIIFSDHAQLSVHTVLAPNSILASLGLIRREGGEWRAGPESCFIECCGGSAFFHPGSLDEAGIARVRASVAGSKGFNRFLTAGEMHECGRNALPFGFCAEIGYCYEAAEGDEKGSHGYPADYPGYDVFYAMRLKRSIPGTVRRGGSLLDIAGIAAAELGIAL